MRKDRWYIIDYGLVNHTSWPFNKYNECCSTSDELSLAELGMYRPIRRMAFDEGKFKPKPFKKVIEAIKNQKLIRQ